MSARIFIDGQAGTTGLGIAQRLEGLHPCHAARGQPKKS